MVFQSSVAFPPPAMTWHENRFYCHVCRRLYTTSSLSILFSNPVTNLLGFYRMYKLIWEPCYPSYINELPSLPMGKLLSWYIHPSCRDEYYLFSFRYPLNNSLIITSHYDNIVLKNLGEYMGIAIDSYVSGTDYFFTEEFKVMARSIKMNLLQILQNCH